MFYRFIYFIFSFLILITSNQTLNAYANASIPGQIKNWRKMHPYIGIQLGGTWLSGRYKSFVDTAGGDSFFSYGNKISSGLLGGVVGIQNVLCNDVFLAIQANTLYNSLSGDAHPVRNGYFFPHKVSLKNNFQFGLDGRIGLALAHGTVTPYILAGYEAGNWTMILSNRTRVSFRGIPPLSQLHFSRFLAGPKIGGGVTFPVTCDISVNAEYSFTWFGRITTVLFDFPTGVLWDHRETIRQNALSLGFNYLY